jgi:predicted metalloprotease
MRWDRAHQSTDVEDRRGQRFGGGGLRIGLGGGIVLLLLSLIFGRNFFADLGSSQQAVEAPPGTVGALPANDDLAHFVAFAFDDAQAYWQKEITSEGRPYRKTVLVLFSEATPTGCGVADSAVGPFYCPADEKVYIDLGFYQELRARFGASGDFAQAYVLAHEVGHHIQNVLGIEQRVRSAQRSDPESRNALSVRTELQADCFAGVWARSTQRRDLLEEGDIEEAMTAAAAVGDDRIQKAATGRINPEKWTHGSAKERAAWFRRGFSGGTIAGCDTFANP